MRQFVNHVQNLSREEKLGELNEKKGKKDKKKKRKPRRMKPIRVKINRGDGEEEID